MYITQWQTTADKNEIEKKKVKYVLVKLYIYVCSKLKDKLKDKGNSNTIYFIM